MLWRYSSELSTSEKDFFASAVGKFMGRNTQNQMEEQGTGPHQVVFIIQNSVVFY